MKQPEISVIMPVYNAGKFLEETIESILNQTFSDFELIVLNDKSTDNSAEIIKRLQAKDSRIIFIDKEQNVGPARLRNEGIALAQGKYIALMDADDISLPNRFKKQWHLLESNKKVGVCGTWFTLFKENGKRILNAKPELNKELRVLLLIDNIIGNPTVMMRKSILEGVAYNADYVPVEDYELWTQLIDKTQFYNIQENLLDYRWHQNNITQTKIDNVNRSIKRIKLTELEKLGIPVNQENILGILQSITYQRGLSEDEILKMLNGAKIILKQNEIIKRYDATILNKEIRKILIKNIRKTKNPSLRLLKYLAQHETELFKKIKTLDKFLLHVKALMKFNF